MTKVYFSHRSDVLYRYVDRAGLPAEFWCNLENGIPSISLQLLDRECPLNRTIDGFVEKFPSNFYPYDSFVDSIIALLSLFFLFFIHVYFYNAATIILG